MKITDTDLKKAIGLDKTSSQNKKFYDWKRDLTKGELIRLAKIGLAFERIANNNFIKNAIK